MYESTSDQEAFAQQLNHARGLLLRSARRRLRNPTWAEDAVAETLLAAWERHPAFDDPDRLHRWLAGVLRHKVVDQLRLHLGPARLAPEDDSGVCELMPAPAASGPERASEDRAFVAALERQLAELPPLQARAFLLHTALGDSAAEVCAELEVTANHLWVLLHRARRRLQQGLAAYAPA